MNRTRIFAVASTCVLLLAGIFATKAARKFSPGPATVVYNNAGTYVTVWGGATTDNLVTLTQNGHPAVLGGLYQLLTKTTYTTLYVKSL